MKEIYQRTINNCKFYLQENDKRLLNEIGVLRGVCYCLESQGETFFYNDKDFVMFIDKQQELLNG